jgi:hypothetical protein
MRGPRKAIGRGNPARRAGRCGSLLRIRVLVPRFAGPPRPDPPATKPLRLFVPVVASIFLFGRIAPFSAPFSALPALLILPRIPYLRYWIGVSGNPQYPLSITGAWQGRRERATQRASSRESPRQADPDPGVPVPVSSPGVRRGTAVRKRFPGGSRKDEHLPEPPPFSEPRFVHAQPAIRQGRAAAA